MITNPYRNACGEWLRGSFHGHSSEGSPCGALALADTVRMYRGVEAGFMAVTDHDAVTDLAEMRAMYPDMVLIHGFEHSRGENMVFAGEEARDLCSFSLNDAMKKARNLLTMVAHPERRPGDGYWTPEKVLSLSRMPDAVEIYNGHYGVERMIARGNTPLYTRIWDEFLTKGCRMWGLANDDLHDPEDFDNAFTMVLAGEASPSAIVEAARSGRCYGSTGLLLENVEETAGRIIVVTAGRCAGRFIGPAGKTLSAGTGSRFEYCMGNESYCRFEGEGDAGRIFLQPMFVERDEDRA